MDEHAAVRANNRTRVYHTEQAGICLAGHARRQRFSLNILHRPLARNLPLYIADYNAVHSCAFFLIYLPHDNGTRKAERAKSKSPLGQCLHCRSLQWCV